MSSLDQLDRPVRAEPPLLRPTATARRPSAAEPRSDQPAPPEPPRRRLPARPAEPAPRPRPARHVGELRPLRALRPPQVPGPSDPTGSSGTPGPKRRLTRLERLRRTERVVSAAIAVVLALGVVGVKVVGHPAQARSAAAPPPVTVEVPRAATAGDLQAAVAGVAVPGWTAVGSTASGMGPLDLIAAARRYAQPDTAQPILADRGYRAGYARSWKLRKPAATLTVVMYAMGTTAKAEDLLAVLGQATAADTNSRSQRVADLAGASMFTKTRDGGDETLVLFAVHNVYVAITESPSPTGPTNEAVQLAHDVHDRLS